MPQDIPHVLHVHRDQHYHHYCHAQLYNLLDERRKRQAETIYAEYGRVNLLNLSL